ncbi:MAG: YceI family protein [Polyangiaceae bacterium]|jgi:polyisoprenoid-binding protein YceI
MALENWKIDTVHSTVGFTVRHLMVSKVHGLFTKWQGTLAFDEANVAASHVEVSIDVASVDTREPQRDAHLRSGDFFEAEKFPQMTFKSTKVQGTAAAFKVTGDLTLRGVTKSVVLDVEYAGRTAHPQMGERAGFSAHTSIMRKDFGVTYNQVLEAGGLALSEKVDITIEIEAIKA